MTLEHGQFPEFDRDVDTDSISMFVEFFRKWTSLRKDLITEKLSPSDERHTHGIWRRAGRINDPYNSGYAGADFLLKVNTRTQELLVKKKYDFAIEELTAAIDRADEQFSGLDRDIALANIALSLGNAFRTRLSSLHEPGIRKKLLITDSETIEQTADVADLHAYYKDIFNAGLSFMLADMITGAITPTSAAVIYQLTTNPGLKGSLNNLAWEIYNDHELSNDSLYTDTEGIAEDVFRELGEVARARKLTNGQDGGPMFI